MLTTYAASAMARGVASVGLAGKDSTVPHVIRAKAIEVVDANGKVRGGVGVLPDGMVSLALSDEDGTVRGTFTVHPDGTADLGLLD